MSKMTLKQGVETTLKAQIPELARVTDQHACVIELEPADNSASDTNSVVSYGIR